MIIFDLEADGLLDEVTKIHCIVTKDLNTNTIRHFRPSDIPEALNYLQASDNLIAHNGIGYDIPVIKKLYGIDLSDKITDTLVLSRLMYTNLADQDYRNVSKYPQGFKLYGSHSLKAWGMRLGNLKGDFGETEDWSVFSEEMLEYCEQDVHVTSDLYTKLLQEEYSQEAIDLEHSVAKIIHQQQINGFKFNEQKAGLLYAELVEERENVRQQLHEVFPKRFEFVCEFTPKRPNRTRGYEAGATFSKIEMVEFNPASREHIYKRLHEKYNWKPTKLTDKGTPIVDESVLKALKYPEAALLNKFLLLNKRIGQLAEGNQALLKCVKSDGRIHGSVNTNGAVTGRMTHSHPNVAQVPAARSLYGDKFRELFEADEGKVIVGADASGLELRCLAHYMNDPKYTHEILNGDIHTANQKAAGLETRDQAKTFIYAFLYGAGDAKIGSIVGGKSKQGKALKQKFLKGIPALNNLLNLVERKASRGYLLGLDKRRLHIRSPHAALNTLLQSAGALIMKKALVIANDLLKDYDFKFVANVHDEIQIECRPEDSEEIGAGLVHAMVLAGEYFKFRCPISGEYQIGKNWLETH